LRLNLEGIFFVIQIKIISIETKYEKNKFGEQSRSKVFGRSEVFPERSK